MPIPPAVLLDLEQDPVRTLVLSSGAEPAAGLVRLGEVVFGVVAFIHSLDDADVLLISCELWMNDPPLGWRLLNEFGMRCGGSLLNRSEPRLLVSGGLDFETDAGREGFVVGICGDVGLASSAVVTIDESEVARIDSDDDLRYFCVVVAVEPVEEGVDLTMAVRPAASSVDFADGCEHLPSR